MPAIEEKFVQEQIEESAFRWQTQIESGERIIVGVNDYVSGDQQKVPLLEMDVAGYQRQLDRLHAVRRSRDNRAVGMRLFQTAWALTAAAWSRSAACMRSAPTARRYW